MNEMRYRMRLTDKLHHLLPDCFIIQNDPRYSQGIPDLLILWHDKWAMLEVKLSRGATIQPNQQFYIELFNDMSFASFICPENEEEVLGDLQQSFGFVREARVS